MTSHGEQHLALHPSQQRHVRAVVAGDTGAAVKGTAAALLQLRAVGTVASARRQNTSFSSVNATPALLAAGTPLAPLRHFAVRAEATELGARLKLFQRSTGLASVHGGFEHLHKWER